MGASVQNVVGRLVVLLMLVGAIGLAPRAAWAGQAPVAAAAVEHQGGEANLVVPDLSTVSFFGGISGRTLLMGGLVVCALGLLFGLLTFTGLKNLPVHSSMLEVSE